MSINQYSPDLPETLWWSQHPQPHMENSPPSKHNPLFPPQPDLWSSHHPLMSRSHNPSLNFNLNRDDDDDLDDPTTTANPHYHHHLHQQDPEKEPMFEKPLTPSDVGKLNRLVIPKQHAEKYFPLGGGDSGCEKSLLLSFEDESGKFWRFRYSYWNSSQSYVLTKGWSRYVKEKRLDAGDVVLFERHRTDSDRLFIGWRRRAAAPAQDSGAAPPGASVSGGGSSNSGNSTNANANVGGGSWTSGFYSAHPYPSHPSPYQPDCLHAGSIVQNQTMPAGSSKRLRLFGVNLECQPDESESLTPDGSSLSSQGPAYHYYYEAHGPNRHNHMDMNFARDGNQMRNRRG